MHAPTHTSGPWYAGNIKTRGRLIEATCPNTAARIERAITYAIKRKRETKVSYFVTDFGHSAMDCPMNRAAYKENTIIFKS
jgi:hypothetical protein